MGLWGSYGREEVTSVRSTGPSFGLWEPGTPIQIRAAPSSPPPAGGAAWRAPGELKAKDPPIPRR